MFRVLSVVAAVLLAGCVSLQPPLPKEPIKAAGVMFQPSDCGSSIQSRSCYDYGDYFVYIDNHYVPKGNTQAEIDQETLEATKVFSSISGTKVESSVVKPGIVKISYDGVPGVVTSKVTTYNGKRVYLSVGRTNSPVTENVINNLYKISNDVDKVLEKSI